MAKFHILESALEDDTFDLRNATFKVMLVSSTQRTAKLRRVSEDPPRPKTIPREIS